MMTTATHSHSADLMPHPARRAHRSTDSVAARAQAPDGAPSVGGKNIACIAMEHCQGVIAPTGVIVEYLDAQIGTWQYSLDEGAHWCNIRTDLINRPGYMGLALERTARLRVLPSGGGSRSGSARMVFHATHRAPGQNNGSYQTYPHDDRGDDAYSITLVLSLADINGTPPSVSAPRLRNKRALAAQRHLTSDAIQ